MLEAHTDFSVLRRDPDGTTLVEAHPLTGRTNQIRVHLQAIGHPVVGDRRYRGAKPSLPMDRPFLHAAHLGFEHPVTGEHLSFDSQLPPDLAALPGWDPSWPTPAVGASLRASSYGSTGTQDGDLDQRVVGAPLIW